MTHPIYPCLWFDGNAKAAADYYSRIFKNSKVISENPVVVIFEINGSKFMALNGGPNFKFNEATSFVVSCDTQEEIDKYWSALTADGGKEGVCGWLKDKFGVSWQIVPSMLEKWMADGEKAERVMQVVMKMKKLDLETMKNA